MYQSLTKGDRFLPAMDSNDTLQRSGGASIEAGSQVNLVKQQYYNPELDGKEGAENPRIS